MNLKRTAAFLLALALLLSVFPLQILAADTASDPVSMPVSGLEGQGTSDDPYRIASEADLLFAVEQLNSGNTGYAGKAFRLTDDISMSGNSFPMIDEFTGVLDGDGHVISGLTINDETTGSVSNYGVAFIRVNRGTVENLTFTGARITTQADSSGDGYSGAAVVAAENQEGGVIRRVTVRDAVVKAPKMSKAAGIAALSGRDPGVHAEISNCLVSDSSFTAGPRTAGNGTGVILGGIVGYSATSVLENCYVSGVALAADSAANSPFNAGLICGYANQVDMNGNVAVGGTITYIDGFSSIYAGAICPRIIAEGVQSHDNLAVSGGLTISPASDGAICHKPGTPVASEELSQERFEQIGWNFDSVWKLENGIPSLRAPGDLAALQLSGSGTAADPYQISDSDDLLYATRLLNSGDTRVTGKSFQLTADLDLQGIRFPMIDEFSGVLDGDGHTISNLTIQDNATDVQREYRAAFIRVNTGSIQNIVFRDPVVTTSVNCAEDGYSGAAVVAGENGQGGTIRACTVLNAKVTAPNASKVAGITCLNGRYSGINASISSCYVSGTFTCGTRTGQYGPQLAGIAAYSATSSILNCVAEAELTVNGSCQRVCAGIICGYPNDVVFRGNVAYGGSITAVGAETLDAGRIYGCTDYGQSLTNNLACGDITINGSTTGSESQNGRTLSAEALTRQSTYEAIGYDFSLQWKMENGRPLPQPFSYGNDQINRLTATIYGDPATQMGFTWYYENGEDAVVRISTTRDMANALEFSAAAESTDSGVRLQASAAGLQPGTRYYYQAGSKADNVFSSVGTFVTAPEGNAFTFLSLSDMEAGSFEEAGTAAASMAAAVQTAPDAAFLLHSGDFTSAARGEEGWQDLLYQSADTLRKLPLVPTAGEEDQGAFANHFFVSAAAEGSNYYSFDYSNAHFAILDTNEDALQCISQQQLDWLRQDVADAREDGAQWIILSLHKGPYTSGPHADDAEIANLRTVLLPVMEELEIDLVIEGHDHILSRTYPIQNGAADDCATYTETVNGKRFEYSVSPEGTVYLTPGTAGTEPDSQISAMTTDDLDAYIARFARSDSRGVPTFAAVTVDGGRLTVAMYEIKAEMCPTLIDGFGMDREIAAAEALISGGQTAQARAAYDALSDTQQKQVSNYDQLVADEAPGLAADGSHWLDSAAFERRAVTVRNDTDLTFRDVAVLVRLDQAPSEVMQFYTSDGERLPSEVETYNASGISAVWVRVPEVAAEAVTGLWVYFGGSNGENPQAVWNDDYRLVEHFADAASIGSRSDSTGSHTGAVTGDIQPVTAADGDAAAQFDNASITYDSIGDDYDRISVSAVFSMTEEDLQQISSVGALVSKYLSGDPTGHNAYLLGVDSNGQLYTDYTCRWWRSNTTQHRTYRNALPPADGTPHLVTLTYDGFTIGTYLDGAPVSEETVFIESSTFHDPSIPTVIGAFSDALTGGFHGAIHEVQISGQRTNAQWESFRYQNYLGNAVTVGTPQQRDSGLTLAADVPGRNQAVAAGSVQVSGVAGQAGTLTAVVDGTALDLGAVPGGAFSAALPLSGTGTHTVILQLASGGQTAQCTLQLETADTESPAQPVLSAKASSGGQTMTVQPASGEAGTIQVDFYQAEAIALNAETLRVYEGSTDDIAPSSEINPKQLTFTPAAEAPLTSTGTDGANPYQIYEVTLTLDQLALGTYHFGWQGQSDRQVHAYAYNFDTGLWDRLASTSGTGSLTMDLTVTGTAYTENSRIYLMIFRGLGIDPASRDGFVPEEGQYDFTMFWNSDTQYMSQFYPEMFLTQYQWIADQYDAYNGVITFNTGDVTNRSNLNYEYNWRVADDGYEILEEAGIPYTIAWGNHDYRYDGKPNEERLYAKYFPLSRFEENTGSWRLVGSCNGTDGMALAGEIQGSKILLLALGYYLDEDVIDWAADLVPQYRDYSVLILTHNFSSGGQITGQNTGLLKQRVIDPNENVKLVLCGHIDGVDLIAPYADRQFYSILQDYQGESGNPKHGGDGLMRLIQVDLENDLVYFHTYSPVTGDTLSPHGGGQYAQVDGLYQKNKDEFAITLDLGGGTEPRSFTTDSLLLYAGEAELAGTAQAAGGQAVSCAGNDGALWYAVLTDSSGNRTVTPIQAAQSSDPETPDEPDSGNQGGSSSGSGGYAVSVEDAANGELSANPSRASAGQTVAVTVTPDPGYRLHSLTVTDAGGNALETTRISDTRYTFRMPGSRVIVQASFLPLSTLPFTDVDEGDWFYDAAAYAYENALMNGVGGGRFAPNDTLTRAMVVTILYRMAGSPELPAEYPGHAFADVSAGAWYSDAVCWAHHSGVVNGVSVTEFAPERSITREQLAAMLYRYAAWQGRDTTVSGDLENFADAATVSDYAVDALTWAVQEALVNGVGSNTLLPRGIATRAQAAAMFMRFSEHTPE